MIVTAAGATVSCLTDNNDGTIALRLAPARADDGTRTERTVVLLEPSLREYADLRTLIVDTTKAVQDANPAPQAPNLTPDEATSPDGQRALLDYQEAVGKWTTARNTLLKALRDPDTGEERTPPYAACIIEVVDRLAGEKVTLDDLVPEALQPRTCTALLEVWDAPLGGPGDLSNNPVLAALAAAVTPEQPTAAPPSDDQAAPGSPVPEESSPPGTESSPPSPQAQSTP